MITTSTLAKHSQATGVALSLSLACAPALHAASQQPAAPAAPVARPNVIILLADDMRSTTIRALGNPEIITPNLDALAASGVAFNRAYIMGGSVGAVCMPSRAMLMTGRNLFSLGGNGETINKDHMLMGEMFAANGYTTCGIGKWHNGTASYARSFTTGAEILFGGMTQNQFEIPLTHFNPTGKYDKYEWPRDRKQICDHVYANKHSAEIFTDAAVQFLDANNASSQPFFLYVAFTTPHDPRQVPQKYYAMYDDDVNRVSVPKNFLPEHPFDNGHMRGRDERLLPWPRKKSEVRAELRDYYATISHLDAQVGRIVEALKKNGLYENTIIIFSADNGLAVGQHGLMGKQNLYEHSIGIPLIWAGPGVAKNKQSHARNYLMDVYPTLCEMLGIPIPASVQAASYAACLRDPALPHREGMYFSFRQFHRAYSDGKYKLIEYHAAETRHTQLFNIETDPLEMENLADKPEMAGVLETMREQLVKSRPPGDKNNAFWTGVLGTPGDKLASAHQKHGKNTRRPAVLAENKIGIPNIGIAGLDAKWSNYGQYLQKLIDTVQMQFEDITEKSHSRPASGTKVTIRFRLNSEGKITDLLTVDGNGGSQAAQICVKSITDRAPYGQWTDDMVAILGDSQALTFTFYFGKP